MSYGTPGGEYTPACRAAVVADTLKATGDIGRRVPHDELRFELRYDAEEWCRLVVLNPKGIFFDTCKRDDAGAPGTWHWPERDPEDDVQVGAATGVVKLAFQLTPDEQREVTAAVGDGLITAFAKDATLRRAREVNSTDQADGDVQHHEPYADDPR